MKDELENSKLKNYAEEPNHLLSPAIVSGDL